MYDQHVPPRRARIAGTRPPHLRIVPASETARRAVAPARSAREARDAALLAAVAYARDAAAFDELRACHIHAVEDAALRLGAAVDVAADIAQAAFAQLWERAWRLAARGVGVRSWLLAIARDAAIAQQRDANAAGAPGEAVFDPLMLELAPALAALPAAQRRVIELRYFESLSFADIAAQTGESVDRVKSHARLAVEALRRRFD